MFDDSPSRQQNARGAASAAAPRRRWYLSIRWKFALSLCAGLVWAAFSLWVAQVWLQEFSGRVGAFVAHLVVFGIAIIPGFMNAFLVTSLLLDRRPQIRVPADRLPAVAILVAAYNEEANIVSTLESIAKQDYPGALQVIVINDGSTDGTAAALAGVHYPWLEVINLAKNAGKSHALNEGLQRVRCAPTRLRSACL